MRRDKESSGNVIHANAREEQLAENYSGRKSLRAKETDEERTGLIDEWVFQQNVDRFQQKWKNIAIVSKNNIAIDGVRAVYRSLCPLRVHIFNDTRMLYEAVLIEKHFRPDVIVWIDSRSDCLKDMAALIIQLNRKLPTLQQLIISECIPVDFSVLPRGVRIASLSMPLSELKPLMLSCLEFKSQIGKLLPKRFMTPGQWRVVRLLVKGLSAREVAEAISISPKSVWGREEEVMRALNLEGHVHKAWFYRSIVEVLRMMPGFGRITKCDFFKA